MNLKGLRRRIDRLDARLVGLLNARARAVLAVAEWKRERGAPVYDAGRERAVLGRAVAANRGPLDDAALERLFWTLLSEFRKFERRAQAAAAGGRSGPSPQATRPKTVAIVGPGLIGGSLAMALRRWTPHRIVGCLRQGERADPRLRGVVHEATDDPAAACAADVVVLAAPVAGNVRWIRRWGPRAKAGSVWTDVGGVKAAVCRAAERALPREAAFVGGHPMAGSEKSGLASARADLFMGATYVLTPTRRRGKGAREALELMRRFARSVGAEPVVLGPEAHDRLVAYASHLPQFAASALAAAAGRALRAPDGRRLAGPGLRDTTRLAESDAGIWTDVAALNRGNIRAAMGAFMDELARAGKLSPASVRGLFRRARAARRELYFRGAGTSRTAGRPRK